MIQDNFYDTILASDPNAEIHEFVQMLGRPSATVTGQHQETKTDLWHPPAAQPAKAQPLSPARQNGLKRSVSLSNIERSPTLRAANRKRIRLDRTHWAGDGDKRGGIERRLSRHELLGLLDRCKTVFTNPPHLDEGLDTRNEKRIAKELVPSTPRSNRRKFDRSLSMPSVSSPGSELIAERTIHHQTVLDKGKGPAMDVSVPGSSIRGHEKSLMKGATVEADAQPVYPTGSNAFEDSNAHGIVFRSDAMQYTQTKGQAHVSNAADAEYDDAFNDEEDLLCSMALDAAMEAFGSQDANALASNGTSPARYPAAATAGALEAASTSGRRRYRRFLVLELSYEDFTDHGIKSPEKVLRLLDESETAERFLHLREDWWDTDVNVGDYIHVVGDFDSESHCIVNNAQNLVILHPDNLVSTTSVAESFDCLRKSVLQDRVRASTDINGPMIYGNMLHQLFQGALSDKDWSNDTLKRKIRELVSQSIEELWCIGESEVAAEAHMKESIPAYQEWARKYVALAPKLEQADAVVPVHRADARDQKTMACVTKTLDIEEHIWSPMYGLKGNIDASVEMKTRKGLGDTKTLAAPLELKTGKNSASYSHRAQTTLYTMLMSDRYDTKIPAGLLYYVRTGEMFSIPAIWDEMRGLIIGRNRMAYYIAMRNKLPPMLKNASKCQRCYALDTCVVYHKAIENGTADTSGLGSLFDKKTGLMTQQHVAFFDKWERLITMEEGDTQRYKKEIWTLLGPDREKLASRMRLLPPDSLRGPDKNSGDGSRFRYKFTRADPPSTQGTHADKISGKSLLSSHIAVGDPIVISSEEGVLALAMGYVVDLQPNVVTTIVDRHIRGIPKRRAGFHPENNQVFVGMETDPEKNGRKEWGEENDEPDTQLYRIDKDEFAVGMGLVRGNLVNLFTVDGDAKRRRLVVDLEAPVFQRDESLEGPDAKLNLDQRMAVHKVMSARDYALILGMPGTGKTTTIACITESLVKCGKSVLLTSYTHSAVDNVLLKLKEERIDFVRLGNKQKVHPAIVEHTPNPNGEISSVEELDQFYNSKMVVATTCLGITHMLFMKRKFDYCIVDEASQLTLPVCLGPLRFADVFVLVGDHYQLPPLVRNPEAKDTGLSLSLFKLLSETHPEAVASLEHQYRMNTDIMELSNALIYNYRLRCGTEEIANSVLHIPQLAKGLGRLHSSQTGLVSYPNCNGVGCWIRDLLDPRRKVVFVNTDDVPATDSRSGDLVHNEVEACLVHQVAEALISSDVEESSVGVISPYRSQLKLISHKLRHYSRIEILTVDRFQGRDKDCVLVSLVRSNRKQNVGELLRDWRRINVAFTRAKRKLIIFGSASTLEGTTLFAKFLGIVHSQDIPAST
ncbi:Tripartite DNA replication factor [Borealophlyctis nickersoniae]|nr:Tripartite DNA replication factor [Borealophlyctis nickersoniae]